MEPVPTSQHTVGFPVGGQQATKFRSVPQPQHCPLQKTGKGELQGEARVVVVLLVVVDVVAVVAVVVVVDAVLVVVVPSDVLVVGLVLVVCEMLIVVDVL